MSKVNHDIRSNNGGTIYHLQETAGAVGQGNLEIPNIWSSDESPLYPIGTKLVLGDRVFHYCHFTTAITYGNVAVLSYSGRGATYGQPDSYDASQAAGVGTIANPFKVEGVGDGDPVENYYAGSYMFIPVAAALGRPTMRILSSTASAYDETYTDKWNVELVLEQPTPVVVAANITVDIFLSRYADVREAWAGGSDVEAFVGVPTRIHTDEYYGWIQTWGPCFVIVSGGVPPGDASYARTCIFKSDGTLDILGNAADSEQIAGYTLAISGAGSEWIMLMIDR